MTHIEYDGADEKLLMLEKEEEGFQKHQRRAATVYLPWLITVLISLCVLSGFQFYKIATDTVAGPSIKGASETFEITLPVLYREVVYKQTLVEHTFANSWGTPAKASFSPPPSSTAFNRVILELNTTVDGVQYDRLAHVFINDVPVWRTSTAEPGNKLVFTSATRDVSKYLPLFQENQANVTLQLDNLVNGKLNGAFNTTLTVYYFLEDEEDENEKPLSVLFTHTNKPANQITQLIAPKPNRTPLLYYPSDKLEFSLPRVNQNTTALKLALYASGNAAEEFWYSNVLEKRKSTFDEHGHSLLGHGPIRTVDVYIAGVKVSTTIPEPVIYSGGISPALWRPIIGVNAFDIKPLEIDLTSFLPELWKEGLPLEVEINNGTQGGKIGQNWIVAANLLHWEDDQIESSSGEVQTYHNTSSLKSFDISTSPDSLFEVIKASHETSVQSNLTYNLFNGSQVPVQIKCTSNTRYSNAQEYRSYGDFQFLSAISSSSHLTEIFHDGAKVVEAQSTKQYPLVASLDFAPMSGTEIEYTADVTNVYGSRILIDGKEAFVLESFQNGTSIYTLSPDGNHGTGNTSQRFAADLYPPFPNIKVDAFADAEGGNITAYDYVVEYKQQAHEFEISSQAQERHEHHEETEYSFFNDLPLSSMAQAVEIIEEHLNLLTRSGEMDADMAKEFIHNYNIYHEKFTIKPSHEERGIMFSTKKNPELSALRFIG